MADLAQDETKEVVLVDGAGTNESIITAAGNLRVDGSTVTQPISAASLPLPTGAATETTLGVVSNSLSIINANITNANNLTQLRPSLLVSYHAGIVSLVAAATPTDIFTITGSASKTVKILRVVISATASLGTVFNLSLVKRSTANSAGTSTTPAVVPNDSQNPAGTAVVRAYTANPTTGTLVGTISAVKMGATTVSPTNVALCIRREEFALQGQPIVLRGTGEVFAVNLGGVTLGGNNFSIYIEWTEE